MHILISVVATFVFQAPFFLLSSSPSGMHFELHACMNGLNITLCMQFFTQFENYKRQLGFFNAWCLHSHWSGILWSYFYSFRVIFQRKDKKFFELLILKKRDDGTAQEQNKFMKIPVYTVITGEFNLKIYRKIFYASRQSEYHRCCKYLKKKIPSYGCENVY